MEKFALLFPLSFRQAQIITFWGILAVGYLDYWTGAELRIFPLYFIPLMVAAWYLPKRQSLLFSFFATPVWTAAIYLTGYQYSRAFVWVFNFITQSIAFALVTLLVAHLKESLDREHHLGRMDPLTKLPNSRFFHEQALILLRLCHRNRRPITLAYLDLDNFKAVNDTLGHLQGDDLLRQVAELFKNHFRSSDLMARIGGDEFVILLPETSATEAQVVLDHLRRCIEHLPQCQVLTVTASIGAVSYRVAPMEIEQLISAADRFMYHVKKTGKNRVLVERLSRL